VPGTPGEWYARLRKPPLESAQLDLRTGAERLMNPVTAQACLRVGGKLFIWGYEQSNSLLAAQSRVARVELAFYRRYGKTAAKFLRS
jgi:hypothetical protein